MYFGLGNFEEQRPARLPSGGRGREQRIETNFV